MKTVELNDATDTLSHYAKLARRGTVMVTRDGRPYAAVIALDAEDADSEALSRNPRFLAVIERSRRRQEQEGGVSIDDVRRRFGIRSKTVARKSRRTR